jgi:hypothetical protein
MGPLASCRPLANRPRRLSACSIPLLLLLLACPPPSLAHEGPPFPIVSDRLAGPYRLSLWTDPDATDDGTPAGQFWVVVRPGEDARAPADNLRVMVSVVPRDRRGMPQSGTAAPVPNAPGRYFVALVMDHEGPFDVRAIVDGPFGQVEVGAPVDATYDQRPAPGLMVVYLLPFVLFGGLWFAALRRRWRANRGRRGGSPTD